MSLIYGAVIAREGIPAPIVNAFLSENAVGRAVAAHVCAASSPSPSLDEPGTPQDPEGAPECDGRDSQIGSELALRR